MSNMPTNKTVFIVGPGFIGWNVLELLIKEGYSVTGLVRRKEHARGIELSGASAVIGDLNDHNLIAEETAKHDIVFHTATADHLPSAKAVLDGVRRRAEKGLMTIYIHTSGASVVDDNAMGAFKTDKIYYDTDPASLDAVADDAPHRPIDLAIVNAQKEFGEKAKIAIILPPMIYGYIPSHDRLTIQAPMLTRFAAKHGYSGRLGKGQSVTSAVHVLDLSRAYTLLLHHLESSTPAQTLENPYYFSDGTGESELSWDEIAGVIGEELHKAGKIEDPKTREIPESEFEELMGDFAGAIFGLNTRTRGVRLRELGWKPREKGWKESFIGEEFPVLLREIEGKK